MLLGAALGFAIGVTTVDKPFTGLLIGLGIGALVGLAAPASIPPSVRTTLRRIRSIPAPLPDIRRLTRTP